MALRHPVDRPVALTVTPGAWIRIPVPGDPWPVQMQIGRLESQAAFIDRDGTQTFAQVRCPVLAAGTYPVRVTTPDGVVESSITVQ